VHGGVWEEITRTDHRLGKNFKRKHRNTGQKKSEIDRRRAEWEANQFRSQDHADGRFDHLPKLSETEKKKRRAAAKARLTGIIKPKPPRPKK
jgi:hypothetical protein